MNLIVKYFLSQFELPYFFLLYALLIVCTIMYFLNVYLWVYVTHWYLIFRSSSSILIIIVRLILNTRTLLFNSLNNFALLSNALIILLFLKYNLWRLKEIIMFLTDVGNRNCCWFNWIMPPRIYWILRWLSVKSLIILQRFWMLLT